MAILAKDILRIDNAVSYKLHLACRNDEGEHPLDAFVSNRPAWTGWNRWKNPNKNDWNREFVLSFMEFYPRRDSWLFGGAFRVLDRAAKVYKLEEIPEFNEFVGRLVVSFHRYQGMRGRAFLLESYLDQLVVREMFSECYAGETFCGYQNINHDFGTLEAVFSNERSDWKSALENIKGVYLIVDKSNGKTYVGSAYGENGVWSRWSCYLQTGHGANDLLTKLIDQKGISYARANFKFSLLEIMAATTPDNIVIGRECYWKNVLLSREFGYCRN